MTTQVLTKPRPGGVSEAQEPSAAMAPAPIYPARVRLSAKLAELEQASADLEDYKARVARAALAEDAAMEDEHLSESEAAERISKAQNERNVYASRQAQREKALGALSVELAKAINEARNELRGPVNVEVARRTEIISARIIEALQIGKAVDPSRMGPELHDLLHFSGPIQVAWALMPSPGIVQPGNNESLVYSAKQILTKFDAVAREAAKTI